MRLTVAWGKLSNLKRKWKLKNNANNYGGFVTWP